jgi:GNAT superfamily N-acetyltransferase
VIERWAPTPADKGLVRQFTSIYEESFPPEERDETASLLDSITEGTRQCHLALDGGLLVGLAVVLPLAGVPAAFLEYLAVARPMRSMGAGGRLLHHLRQALAGETAAGGTVAEGLLLEVERPEDSEGEERATRERRLRFYQRNGATVLRGISTYRAPALNGQQGALPYTLMWLPTVLGGAAPRRDDLRTCVTAVLTQSYLLGTDDPLVRQLAAEVIDG